jgi:hypothetical protein
MFETVDEGGSSTQFTSTVGTSPVSLPSIAGNAIQEITIYNPQTNPKSAILYVSWDAGVTFRQIPWGSEWGKTLKGRKTQIQIKASAAATNYEVTIDFEATP